LAKIQGGEVIKTINKMLIPIKRKILLLIGRAVVTYVDSSQGTQRVQLSCLQGETLSDSEHFEPYGLTAYPETDSQAIALFPNGNRDNCYVICVHDRRYRIKTLSEGEVALYSKFSNVITMKADGTIEIKGSGGTVEFAPLVSKIVSWINGHKHLGVTTGGGTSGAPSVPMAASDIQSSKVKIS